MKKNKILLLISFICLSFIFNGCVQKSNTTTIKLEVKNFEADSIIYTVSKDGIGSHIWLPNSVSIDSNMNAVIEIENPELNSISIWLYSREFKKSAFLFIMPGEEISVTFDLTDTVLITTGGKYEKGLQFITDFENNRMSRHETDKDYFGLLFSDTIPESIKENFENHKGIELDKLETIYENKEIDNIRYKAIKDHINYSYLNELLSTIYRKSFMKEIDTLEYYNNAIAYPINIMQNAFQEMLADLFQKYPVDQEYPKLEGNLSGNLFYYLWYQSLDDPLFLKDRDEELKIAEKHLDPFLFEIYFASQFLKISAKEPFEATEMRYEAFKARYPNSMSLPGIDFMLPRLQSIYYQYYPPDVSADIEDLTEEVVLVENYQEIESINQIIERFRGKVVYIDFWASWCAPCLGEFEYAQPLKAFADKNDIILLYISTDKNESNWVKSLNKNKLSGYHARMVTDEFRSDLTNYEIYGIPRYMIVNKDGLIVEPEAKRPSSGQELYEQLLQYVN